MESIVKKIDHTLLRQDITSGDIERLCREAREYEFYSVMIHAFPRQCVRSRAAG